MEATTIMAIDPGSVRSAWVLYDPVLKAVLSHGKEDNAVVLGMLTPTDSRRIVCEMVASYGRPVGAEVFDTVRWIGRFEQRVSEEGGLMRLFYRRDVKRHLCGSENKVNDAVIRQRLIDIFGPGRSIAIGTRRCSGPLYGIVKDEWQALALAVTFAETSMDK